MPNIFFMPMTASAFLTDAAQVKAFMKDAGYLWRTILAATTTTPATYLDIAPTGANWDGNSMQRITTIRDLIAENTSWDMENTARQPAHFDYATTLATGVRSVETGFPAAVKNSVSNIMSRWDTFIKAEAATASGDSTITTTKAYVDSIFDLSDWITQLGSTEYGADFLNFWRYTMRNELRVPIVKFTYNSVTTSWDRTILTGATTSNAGSLDYGASLEVRLTVLGGASVTLATYAGTDSTGASVTGTQTTALSTVYDKATRSIATGHVALGTKTNLVTITQITSTVATHNDELTVYSV